MNAMSDERLATLKQQCEYVPKWRYPPLPDAFPLENKSCRDLIAEITRLRAENAGLREDEERLKKDVAHWRMNHKDLACRNQLLRERTDLPPEAIEKRLGYYDARRRLEAALATLSAFVLLVERTYIDCPPGGRFPCDEERWACIIESPEYIAAIDAARKAN